MQVAEAKFTTGEPSQQALPQLLQLLRGMKTASSTAQIKEVEGRLYECEQTPGFVSRLVEVICGEGIEPEQRLAAASYLRRMISRCREAPISTKLDMCRVMLLLLRSDASVKLKKVALAGSTLMMQANVDTNGQVQHFLCERLEEELLNEGKQPGVLNPKVLEYIALLGQLVLLSDEVPLEFVLRTFDHFMLIAMKVTDFTASVLQQSKEIEPGSTRCLTLLKELTVLLRIIFKRKDFASSDFFKLILLSRDIVLLLERVYVMSTNQGEFANSLLEVSELEACAILNNAKSNCVNVQCRMLKELIEVDRRDEVQTQSYLYERSAPHLDMFLASILNCRWVEHQHAKKYQSVRKAVEEILRFTAVATAAPSCYEHFARNRDSWIMDLLVKMFQEGPSDFEEFEADPENYLSYRDQVIRDDPNPDQLDGDDQEDLVVHVTAKALLRALFKSLDGACSFFCKWCFAVLVNAKPEDPARLVALKLLGVIHDQLAERADFVRQLVAYFEMRIFNRPSHVVQKIESCLHVMVLSKYLACLKGVSPTLKLVALQLVMDILTDRCEAVHGNPAIEIAANWLIYEVFKDSTEHCLEVLSYLLAHFRPESASNERLDAILQVVCDSSTVHAHPQLVDSCAAKMVEVVNWQFQNTASIVLAGKAWDVLVQLCCSKLLHPSSVPLLENQLRPLLRYIKEPVRVDFGDEFVQILINFLTKTNCLDEFTVGSASLLLRIFEENGSELDEMLHLGNLYLMLGSSSSNGQSLPALVIFTQLALRGLDARVSLHGRVEAAILLHALPLHAAALWKFGQMPAVVNRLHQIFSEEQEKISSTLAENLLVGLILIAAASIDQLPAEQRKQIVAFCLSGEKYVKDSYALKGYCCGLVNLLQAHLSNKLPDSNLDSLLELIVDKLHRLFIKLQQNTSRTMKLERTERFAKMMERLHNPVTESDVFKQFKTVMEGFWSTQPSLYNETVPCLSISAREKLKVLFSIQTTQVGIRRVVKIKRG